MWPGQSEEARSRTRGQGLVSHGEEFGVFPSTRIGSERWRDPNGLLLIGPSAACFLLGSPGDKSEVRLSLGSALRTELSQSRWKMDNRKRGLPNCNSVLIFPSRAGSQPHTEVGNLEVNQTQFSPSRSSVRLGPGKSSWLLLLSSLPFPALPHSTGSSS